MAATIETHQRKTIKLVVPPHYHSLGYQDYVAELNLSDTPLTLKSAGSRNGDVEGMTLLFRGRRITPDEENLSFEQLMEKVTTFLNHLLIGSVTSVPTRRFSYFIVQYIQMLFRINRSEIR